MFFLKDATRSSEVVEEENNWYGFMFVGDNIDKNVNPRFQRCENRGQSLHYFHGYALRDRVDLNEHARYKRGLGCPENGVCKINSHQREALSLVTLLCTSGGGCVPLY